MLVASSQEYFAILRVAVQRRALALLRPAGSMVKSSAGMAAGMPAMAGTAPTAARYIWDMVSAEPKSKRFEIKKNIPSNFQRKFLQCKGFALFQMFE
jgi:hypothetical protein